MPRNLALDGFTCNRGTINPPALPEGLCAKPSALRPPELPDFCEKSSLVEETQVQEAQGEETLDITPPIAYKRRSFPRVQPQERQQAKPCLSRTPPPPPPQAAAAPSPAKPAASRPRSPSRRNRAPSRRLLDSVSCKQLRSEP
ncbi:hypothetical protein F2Q69_00022524 [Brassica cretica]|uniref:Uncharacterized protein n=1 Tax=Brassica cretica TaxID=69181 RepID=A0A8S9Q3B5_BRACR|nr:hypothetical protein F2Q69_00022524 [Brassica cretica]